MDERNKRVVIPGVLLFVLSIAAFMAAAGQAAEPPEVPEEVERHIREVVDRRLHVAIAVGLVSPGGESYLNVGSTALTEGEPVDEDTVFEIGSITKAFTSILLADMEKRGLVGLEDPIHRYLPEGAGVPSRGRDIRLLDLATHSSGLPRMPTNFDPGTGGYRSFAGFVADRQLGVVVLTNTVRGVDAIGFHLLDASLPLPELPEAPKKKPLFSKN